MANSDNVLRCGLTAKHIDLEELTRVLYFHPFTPELISPRFPAGGEGAEPGRQSPAGSPVPGSSVTESPAGWWTYPSPCREFSLSVIRNVEGPFPIPGPAIIVVTSGRLSVSAGGPGGVPASGPGTGGARTPASWDLGPGESAFIPPPAMPLNLSGTYTLYAASIPSGPLHGGAESG
jgi:mannose-6-phosphate isomerase